MVFFYKCFFQVYLKFSKQIWCNPDHVTLVPQGFVEFVTIGTLAVLGFMAVMLIWKHIKDKYGVQILIENDISLAEYIGDIEENYLKLVSNISETNKKQHFFDKQWPNLNKYLFNIDEDPEEKENLAPKMTHVLEKLRIKARNLYSSFVPRNSNGTWSC